MKRLLILVLSLFATPCMGQDNAEIASLYSTSLLQTGLTQVSRASLAAAQRSVLGEPLPAANVRVARAELHYQSIEGISRTLRQQLASRAIASNPSQAYGIRRALATDAIWLNFDKALTTFGFSSGNLADVMASYYVRCWEVVNATDAQPVFMRAVRNRLYWMLTYSPEIMLMSDIEKQRTAETLGILTAVAHTGREELNRQGDQIGMVLLQTSVYKSMLMQGIDLKQLTLSSRGFSPAQPVTTVVIPPPPKPLQQAIPAVIPPVIPAAPPQPTQTRPAPQQNSVAPVQPPSGLQPYPAYVQYQAQRQALRQIQPQAPAVPAQ